MTIRKWNWEAYIYSRPDLKKNWNSPFKALIHAKFVTKYDSYLKPHIPIISTIKWRKISKKDRYLLHSKYKLFRKELMQEPDVFEKSPVRIKSSKKTNQSYVLITHVYFEQNEMRQKEFMDCLDMNSKNPLIREILIYFQKKNNSNQEAFFCEQVLHKNPKVKIKFLKTRLDFKTAFESANSNYPNSNVIIANADIYFTDTLAKVNYVNLDNQLLCLTRWDVQKNGSLKLFFQGRGSTYSHDAWIFKTPFIYNCNCDIFLGTPNCDGYLANQISTYSNVQISNPCLDVQACHKHLSEYRTDYLKNELKNVSRSGKKRNEQRSKLQEVKWQYLVSKK